VQELEDTSNISENEDLEKLDSPHEEEYPLVRV
jgi:hypothetical protein